MPSATPFLLLIEDASAGIKEEFLNEDPSIQQYLSSDDFLKNIERLSNTEDYSYIQDLVFYLKGQSLMATSSKEAEKTFQNLIEKCSDASLNVVCSPVILKKARINLIELRLLNNRDSAISELEEYINFYPDDDYAMYLLAYLYNESGRDASLLYKRLYIRNSIYCRFIDSQINIKLLTHEEFEQKIKGLIEKAEYEESERLIRRRFEYEKNLVNLEALRRLLGTVYFRQKKYAEAAKEFLASKEYYLLALSYLRSGNDEEAKRIIEKLIRSKDRRVVPIAIAYARSLRDKGEVGESINYLKELLKHFPVNSEQIRWAIAWTYYMTGDYKEAKRVLTTLRDKYNKPRYEYWLLRAKERSSSAAFSISGEQTILNSATEEGNESGFKLISQQDNGIYSLFAGIRLRRSDIRIITDGIGSSIYALELSKTSLTDTFQFPHIRIKRAHIFIQLGLKAEATEEISILLKRCLGDNKTPSTISSDVEIIKLSGKLEEFNDEQCRDLLASIGFYYYKTGQYQRAVSLYSKLKSVPSIKDRIDETLIYPVIYSDYIVNASKKYGVDPFLILAIAREESRYNPEAISPAGAIGLMQIMPSTARRLSQEIRSNASDGGEMTLEGRRWHALLTDPALNIELGAFYLSRLIKRYGVLSYAIAAYNAGEVAVDSWLKNNYSGEDEFIEDIPYGETINYVKRVLTTYEKYLRIYRDRGIRRENKE